MTWLFMLCCIDYVFPFVYNNQVLPLCDKQTIDQSSVYLWTKTDANNDIINVFVDRCYRCKN